MSRNLVLSLLVSLLAATTARSEIRFFVAPDRFEVEVVSGVPSLRVMKLGNEVVARATLVPAYDVGLSAVSYQFRNSAEEVEVRRLSMDVRDIALNNHLLRNGLTVQRVEKERDRDRISIRVVFTPDLTIEQVRLLFTSPLVYGTVRGIFVCPEGVPETICDFKEKDLPAANQFQQAADGSDQRVAYAKFVALNRFKAETLAQQAGRVAGGDSLDRLIRDSLLEPQKAGDVRCREGLAPYPKSICEQFLEESRSGSLSEALFSLAKKAFPEKIVSDHLAGLVFGGNGLPLENLAFPPSATASTRKRIDYYPSPVPVAAVFEHQLDRWGRGEIDASTYRQYLERYVKWIFPGTGPTDRGEVVDTLLLLRTFEANTRVNKVLLSIPIRWLEFKQGDPEKREQAEEILTERVAASSHFEVLADSKYAGREEWEKYLDRHYAKAEDAERERLVASFMKIKGFGNCPEHNRSTLRFLFRELERLAGPMPPELADPPVPAKANRGGDFPSGGQERRAGVPWEELSFYE